jgi:hypothetical protein
MMKELLVRLNIPVELAEKAILNTFRILRLKNSAEESPENLILASYRKTSDSVLNRMKLKESIEDNRDLFENEDALKRYLNRLNELLKKEGDNVYN